MALTSLVDTSVLTRLANPDVRAAVAPLVRLGQVGRCTVSDLEVGYSARNGDEWDTMQSALAVFPPIEVVSWDIDEAKQSQRALAALGLRGRKVPDLIIAAVAKRMKLTVLHYDQDFELIEQVTRQKTRWVVARGAVD